MKHVAIQKDLTPIKSYLEDKGYDVREFDGNAQNAIDEYGEVDAIVVTGMDNNTLGMQDTACRASIIDATGKDPQQVEEELCKKK
ncbi:YkuS family protein [Vallitalea okinawensis]|uniref:YkuS family protein n=1 Tax=Vallitalea okinawensis TaxID=2078660 RepID=UPI000CFBDF5B|nr:YkuS family protein [Vallitalea okinawensis]